MSNLISVLAAPVSQGLNRCWAVMKRLRSDDENGVVTWDFCKNISLFRFMSSNVAQQVALLPHIKKIPGLESQSAEM